MEKILGASWATSLMGYAVAGAVAGYQVYEASQGSSVDWKQIGFAVVAAVYGRITKQANVSNAPHPLAEAQAVDKSTSTPLPPK